MPSTIGYHYVRSAYGLWLPGDDRGNWSEAWDELIGFTEPHTLHAGDPVRHRMAEERRAHPPVRWSPDMRIAIARSVEECAAQSDWSIAALGIQATHLHLAITYTTRDIDGTAKWLGQQMTKAVHRGTTHAGPLFCKNHWLQFIYEPTHWDRLLGYINAHNQAADGVPSTTDDIDAFIKHVNEQWEDHG
jgi:hypothetical protein